MLEINTTLTNNENIEVSISDAQPIEVNILGYASGGVTEFYQLNDTPNSYLGQANSFLLVNDTETGIKYSQTVPIAQITNLQAILDSKFNTSNYSTYFNTNLASKTTDNLTQGATNLYLTLAEKSKLAGLEAGAEVNINADWNASNGDAQILNKPDITVIARQAISETATGLSYSNTTGVLSLDSSHIIPTEVAFNNKVDSENGKGLSENDFTDTLKSKLDGIEPSAQVNTVKSVNSKTGNVNLTTQDILENINLYFTNVRADARITAQKGVIDGIASLDSTGKVPISQLPSISGGGITYKGTWDASTGNYPTLTPNDGEFWVISVAGTIFGTSYSVGDWIIYETGTGWSRVPSGSAVSSVNGKTGTVVLTTSDIAEGSNEYYTNIKVSANADVIKGVSANTWGNHALAGYAKDLEVIHLLGDETIYGNKTFDDTLYINDKLNVGSSTFDPINPEFLKVDGGTSASFNIISAYSDYDSYVQMNLKNANTGETASSDFVATADIGTESSNYIDLGINNSNYESPPFNIVKALDGYGYVDGGDFALGTATDGKVLRFFTGGTEEANERVEISNTAFSVNIPVLAPNLVVTSTTINGYSLASNINLTKSDINLENVNNTSDADKPVSTATQIELNKIKNLAIAMAVAL